MGRPNCVLPLNAEALAWEKEEDTTQVGKITEREVISNRARCLCLWSSGHSMRFFKDVSYFFFSPKGKSGLKGKVCHIGLPPHLEHAEEVELEMRRGGRGQAK